MIGGELVRESRRRAGLTQVELAGRAGTTQSAIARLEAGTTSPALEQVERLMRLCGFQLTVALAPYDDSDLLQAQAADVQSAEERALRLRATVRTLRSMRLEVMDGS